MTKMDYETGRKYIEGLAKYYERNKNIRNEATTRLQLIDTLFFECLGWNKNEDVFVEERLEKGYCDYIFSAPRRLLIVEAKKEGDYFDLPSGKSRIEYNIKSLMRDYPSLKEAIEQVAEYCQGGGVPFAAISNGHQLVAFIATRNDGISPMDGKALVFPSLNHMQKHFLVLWEALSKPAIEKQNMQVKLAGKVLPELPAKLSSTLLAFPGTKIRNTLQGDLQNVAEIIIEDVAQSRELEEVFLEECYCESGELSQYSSYSKKLLLARYAALFDEENPGPATVAATNKKGVSKELLEESLSRRPIILIGDKGVGKTTFIRHLMKVDAKPLFDDAIAIYINLGTKATLASDLNDFILDEIARQLIEEYGVDIEEDSFVRGVYNLELKRFEKGINKRLKIDNPKLFSKKQISFLEEKIKRRDQHLKNTLHHLAAGRKKQVIIFLDNADQREDVIQEQAFLIAQEISSSWEAMVFVALRPETFHRSHKMGALGGYHPKAFTIFPPRIDKVIKKRLHFALKLTSGEIPIESISGDIGVKLESLDAFIRIFLDSLDYPKDQIGEFIDAIASGNVRLALDLVRNFFGSGHVNTKKILDIYESTGQYIISFHEFLRAVTFGDYVYYEPESSSIANLFDVSQLDLKEHFLIPILIKILEVIGRREKESRYVDLSTVYELLQSIGYTPEQIDNGIVNSFKKSLIETAARRMPEPGKTMPRALRATSVGLYHVNRLCNYFCYIDAILTDVSVLNKYINALITNENDIVGRLDRAEIFRKYLDEAWESIEHTGSFYDWNLTSEQLKKDIERARYKNDQRMQKVRQIPSL